MLKNICIISDGYPAKNDPFFTFVEQLAIALVDAGINVTVIAPQSISKYFIRGARLHPFRRVYNIRESNAITVYQPYIVTLGSRFPFFNRKLMQLAIKAVIKFYNIKPQVMYGHFWHCCYYAYKATKSKPLIVASGESDIMSQINFDSSKEIDFFRSVSGVICVSNKNKLESINLGFTTEDKCITIPNAVNPLVFRKMDKQQLRKKYGFSENDFIVAFTGSFEYRKGAKRLSDAISLLNEPSVKVFFIGRLIGESCEDPVCKGILYKSHLDHSLIPDYLNMADVFCLPTLREGCCNAIIEALACGLPIISSDLSFNYDVLNNTNSILVNPMDIQQISDAIKRLFIDKELRDQLSRGALETATSLTISNRAKKIIRFIENRCDL